MIRINIGSVLLRTVGNVELTSIGCDIEFAFIVGIHGSGACACVTACFKGSKDCCCVWAHFQLASFDKGCK